MVVIEFGVLKITIKIKKNLQNYDRIHPRIKVSKEKDPSPELN